MKLKNLCLVMTGCIKPSQNITDLHVRNTVVRKKQYFEAIYFYIKNTKIQNIVFCDNTEEPINSELVKLAKEYDKCFEWMCFSGDIKRAEEKGKGYGEGEILSYVLKNSILIKQCTHMAKITGRLILRNIDCIVKLLSGAENYFNSYIDKNNSFFIDTRFFVINIFDYQDKFLNAYLNVNDRYGYYLEHSLASEIQKNDFMYRNFPIALDIRGVSGSTGMMYYTPRAKLVNRSVRKYIRYVFKAENKYRSISELQEEFNWDEDIWIKNFEKLEKKRIIIYGAGIVGKRFYNLCRKHSVVIAWVDKDYKQLKIVEGRKIVSPVKIKEKNCDYIVIAIRNINAFDEAKERIEEMGIPKNKIIWGIPKII